MNHKNSLPHVRLRSLVKSVTLVTMLTLSTSPAWAGRDVYGLGDGHDGALNIRGTSTTNINVTTTLRTTVAAGATQVRLQSSTGFSSGDLIMLIRVGDRAAPAGSGNQSAIDLTTDAVGQYELARITSFRGGSRANIDAPLKNGFLEDVTQIVLVREYTTVSLSAGATIQPLAWNGSTGGIVAFLATGAVTINGAVTTTGRGFRGGVLNGNGNSQNGCTALDLAAPAGQSKGEGIVTSRYGNAYAGRGNFANGAGGGICHNSGGGGGGHATAGGQGGNTWIGDGSRAMGGLGGVPLTYDLANHATFGGGGGAGHQNNSLARSGGNGGGFIFIRAASLSGTGSIRADGDSVPFHTAANDGQGGGGAGGAVVIRVSGNLDCGNITANGGNGGSFSTADLHGPGGAGGAGRILFQAASIGGACNVVANVGATGTWTNGTSTSSHGATPASSLGIGIVDAPYTGGYNPSDQDGDGILDVNEFDGDTDGDGVDDYLDPDDDGDTVPTAVDFDYLDPFVCADSDGDSCDDCSVLAMPDVANDGLDSDGDGVCDKGDQNPFGCSEFGWQEVFSALPPGAVGASFSALVDAADGALVAVGTASLPSSPEAQWHVFRSVDAITWAQTDAVASPGQRLHADHAGRTSSGAILVVGGTNNASNVGTWMVRRSTDHGVSFTTVDSFSNGLASAAGFATGIATAAGRPIFVGGYHKGTATERYRWVVRRSDDDGTTWVTDDEYDPDFGGSAKAMAFTPSGDLVVPGYRWDGYQWTWVVRLRSSDGSWSNIDEFYARPSPVSGSFAYGAIPASVAVGSTGTILVSGTVLDDTGFGRWTTRRSGDGGLTWTSADAYGIPCVARSAKHDSMTGDFYVTGSCHNGTNYYMVVRVSSDDGVTWSTIDEYESAPGFHTDGSDLIVSPVHGVMTVGRARNVSNVDHAMVRQRVCVTP